MRMKCKANTKKRINKCQPLGIRASTTSYQLTFIVNDVVGGWRKLALQVIYYAPDDTHQNVIHLLALHPVINWLCSSTDGRLRSITLCTLLFPLDCNRSNGQLERVSLCKNRTLTLLLGTQSDEPWTAAITQQTGHVLFDVPVIGAGDQCRPPRSWRPSPLGQPLRPSRKHLINEISI